jgi:hypothetical protein
MVRSYFFHGEACFAIAYDFSITISAIGRTYHYLPRTGGAGGLQYFTFDASQTELSEHENSITNTTTRRRVALQAHFLKQLYNELLQCNYFV